MLVDAAVARPGSDALTFERLTLDEPRDDEVRVRVVAAGVCHTDAAVRDQIIPTPLPAVLGHEGAGIVEAVGAGVRDVRVGDHVVMSTNSCGRCRHCLSGELAYCERLFECNFAARRLDGTTAFASEREPIGSHFFGQSAFATAANVAERSIVRVPDHADLTMLAPLGCGMQTGAGAMLHELRPAPGSSVAVFGAGAVGLAAVMAARLTPATTIIAIDVVAERLELAAELGATHVLDGRDPDLGQQLRQATMDRGIDRLLDTTGLPHLLRSAVDALAVRGRASLVGSSASGTEVRLEIGDSLNRGWTFGTVIQGSSVPQVLIPALIELWSQGRFPFDRLITHYPSRDIDRAFHDSEHGIAIKPVIVH